MVSGSRAVARCDELGLPAYSDTPGGLFRGFLTPAFLATQRRIGGWMVEAGMTVRHDAAANLIGRYEGAAPGAPALVIGSHIDSVRNAGCYDGPLGVMLGIECVAALASQGIRCPFAIEVYAFGDEEGSRFPASMLTSRAVAGTLVPAQLDVCDGDGITLETALEAHAQRAPGGMTAAARTKGDVLAYLEAHIEQGPALEAADRAVGVVTGIAAQLRYRVTLEGVAGHAGTTAMGLRRDALAGAAEAVLAVERIAGAGGDGLVATVGRLEALPGAANVIPGRVSFSLDVRALDPAIRNRAAAEILDAFAAIAARRALGIEIDPVQDLSASPCDPRLIDLLAAAMADAGQPDMRLASGAGHDAMVMAALCPTAMLFVRCREGISHNPAEHVAAADAEVALQVMLGFIDRLGTAHDA